MDQQGKKDCDAAKPCDGENAMSADQLVPEGMFEDPAGLSDVFEKESREF
jgi:hypothetical protein